MWARLGCNPEVVGSRLDSARYRGVIKLIVDRDIGKQLLAGRRHHDGRDRSAWSGPQLEPHSERDDREEQSDEETWACEHAR